MFLFFRAPKILQVLVRCVLGDASMRVEIEHLPLIFPESGPLSKKLWEWLISHLLAMTGDFCWIIHFTNGIISCINMTMAISYNWLLLYILQVGLEVLRTCKVPKLQGGKMQFTVCRWE